MSYFLNSRFPCLLLYSYNGFFIIEIDLFVLSENVRNYPIYKIVVYAGMLFVKKPAKMHWLPEKYINYYIIFLK